MVFRETRHRQYAEVITLKREVRWGIITGGQFASASRPSCSLCRGWCLQLGDRWDQNWGDCPDPLVYPDPCLTCTAPRHQVAVELTGPLGFVWTFVWTRTDWDSVQGSGPCWVCVPAHFSVGPGRVQGQRRTGEPLVLESVV